MKIAIIGAGLSGSHMYNLLSTNKSYDISIFEKSRGSGGRCSTRYINIDDSNEKIIDHGTPFFQTNDKYFLSLCTKFEKENILVKKEDTFYPINGINKICSSLINHGNLIPHTQISEIIKIKQKYTLIDTNKNTYANFDKVIITIPAPQVLDLSLKLDKTVKTKLLNVSYDSIGTLLVYSNHTINHLEPNILDDKINDDRIFRKVINNSTKYSNLYKNTNFSSYVLHLQEEITNKKNFTKKDQIKEFILSRLREDYAIEFDPYSQILSHFWKYAIVRKYIKEDYLINDDNIGFCGDYYNGNDLNSTISSSLKLYQKMF